MQSLDSINLMQVVSFYMGNKSEFISLTGEPVRELFAT